MMNALAHSLHTLDAIFLGIIPWWFYVAASLAAAVIITVEFPNRLGLVIGLMVALILGDIGFTAKGYQLGAAAIKAEVRAQVQAEHDRLAAGFQAQIAQEAARADLAETQNQTLRQERQDAIDKAPPGDGGPIVIPAVIATKLWLIGHPPGRPDGSAQHPRSPPEVPRVLRPGNQPAGTH